MTTLYALILILGLPTGEVIINHTDQVFAREECLAKAREFDLLSGVALCWNDSVTLTADGVQL